MATMTKLKSGWKAILAKLTLFSGSHKDRSNGLCAMEAAAWIANEPHSDSPACVCPVIGAFMRSWNDALPDNETRDRLLKPLIPLTINTRGDKALEEKRAFMCVDWVVRTFTPEWLELCDKERYAKHIAVLRATPEVTDWKTLIDVTPVLVNAQKEAAAAWDAARAAARAAAGDAAWAAARDAAWAAASYAVKEKQTARFKKMVKR